MILTKNHTAHCRIILPERCDEVTRYAAEELSKYLGEITGADFPIGKEPSREGDILVGFDHGDLPEEGYRYHTAGGHLHFLGKGRGLLYGVYAFLEEELGIRFFTPEVTHIPGAPVWSSVRWISPAPR